MIIIIMTLMAQARRGAGPEHQPAQLHVTHTQLKHVNRNNLYIYIYIPTKQINTQALNINQGLADGCVEAGQ